MRIATVLAAIGRTLAAAFRRCGAAPGVLVRTAGEYRGQYRALGFLEKHSVAGLWMNALLSLLAIFIGTTSIFVTVNIYREQKLLQVVSNRMQEQERREERFEKIKGETAKSVGAFDLNNIAPPSPAPKSNSR